METGWENSTKKEEREIYPAPGAKSPLHYKPRQEDSLLLVQVVLCVAVVIFVMLVRNMDAQVFAEMQKEFNDMLTQGVQLDREAQLVRFADGAVQSVREVTQNWVEGLSAQDMQLTETQKKTGMGGFWPVKKHVVPKEATLNDYTIKEPLLLPVSADITSGFGFRKNPVTGVEDFHMGIDLGADEGTGVAAALEGQVTQAGWSKIRGNYIILHHRAGLQTLYQHLACGFVRVGEQVQTGQILGNVGSTGLSTGPHLHFELVVDGKRVNPARRFPQQG